VNRRTIASAAVACVLMLSACTSSSPSTSTPVHTYLFSASSLQREWAIYDTTGTAEPHSRVPSLVTVTHGVLHVTTTGDQGSGLCLCKSGVKPAAPYGRWDVRARAGVGAGHGFAILLWPNSNHWPQDGEIDIAEFPGTTRMLLQTTVHYGADNRHLQDFTPGNFAAWHTYSVIWRRTSITFLVDGRPVHRVVDPAAIPTHPMHLALQAGADSSIASPASATLDVAWVKMYR
jgi:hypothetical protein